MVNSPELIQSLNPFRGGLGAKVVAGASLERTTSGLILFDDFDNNGVQTNTVGNGWTEQGENVAADWQITSNDPGRCFWDNAGTGRLERSSPAMPASEWILQVALSPRVSNAFPRAYAQGAAHPTDTFYDIGLDNNINEIEMRHVEGGSLINQTVKAFTVTTNSFYKLRMVGRLSGADLVLSGYHSAGTVAIGAGDVNGAVTSVGADVTDTSPILSGGFYGFNPSRQSHFGYILLTGADVKVTGLPTGYKAKIDSEAAVTEVGGTATIPRDSVDNIIGTTITVLNASNEEQASLTPDAIVGRQGDSTGGGIVGGDIFTFTAAP